MVGAKPHSQRGAVTLASIKRWWASQTLEKQRTALGRTAVASCAFGFLAVGMPMLSAVNETQIDDQRLRAYSAKLAHSDDPSRELRTDPNTSRLFEHEWLRSVEYSLERDPGSALNRFAALERDRAALKGLKSFETVHMSRAEDMRKQTQCLSEAIYYEARSERTSGQLAVAEVIMNRVKDHRYPNTICDVVYQGATRTTGCQFTFTCDGAMAKTPRGTRWDKAQTIASHVLMDLNEKKTGGATHYHATYVNPVWNSGLIRTQRIGTHIFYRFPRGGEWATASARQRARVAQPTPAVTTITPEATAPARDLTTVRTTADLNAGQRLELVKAVPTQGSVVETQDETAVSKVKVEAS
ncbi:MAG: cell wall hydrolase [Pseudomonadota bacterium]